VSLGIYMQTYFYSPKQQDPTTYHPFLVRVHIEVWLYTHQLLVACYQKLQRICWWYSCICQENYISW